MASLQISYSHDSLFVSSSSECKYPSASPSSSKVSIDQLDDDNTTITSNQMIFPAEGKKKSVDDLRLLAVSTHMTEISYAISDIQTRIFEIQELRHKSYTSTDCVETTKIIDQAIMNLDERLESTSKGLKSINESLDPFLQSFKSPTTTGTTDCDHSALLRKHTALMGEWETVQDESDVLREELKEDKWLTVFRTVTDQADGMMSSLEKAVNRCQEFIWQVHRQAWGDGQAASTSFTSSRSEHQPITYEVYTSILESFEAKKKHYMPATSKVLSIIDKGVRDRVTKNGETLRRHAESAKRWKHIRDLIANTDADMATVHKILLAGETEISEAESSTSGTMSIRNGYLATSPPSRSRTSRATSTASTLSRSISPFRKFARRITGTNRSSTIISLTANKRNHQIPTPSSEPNMKSVRRQRTSIFPNFRASEPPTPTTPGRLGHKLTQSLTPDCSPVCNKLDVDASLNIKTPSNKQKWNSSTKVDPEDRILVAKVGSISVRRPPSASGMNVKSSGLPSIPIRSLSRASAGSSRPRSSVASSISTTHTSSQQRPPPMPVFHPLSRAQTPSSHINASNSNTTPRSRPKTPSHIPAPAKIWRSISSVQSEGGWNGDDDSGQSLSPSVSVSGMNASGSGLTHPPRPPSRSMIPVPSVQLSTPSRPCSVMSNHQLSDSPRTLRNMAFRAQTPELALCVRAQQITFFQGTHSRTTHRPSVHKLPPSSFRDSSNKAPSRPRSRAGVHTPTYDEGIPMYEYMPGNINDPLDVEVGVVVNSIAHGLLVERVDPPLQKTPMEGEEIKAQYAFTNALSRKVVTCRLTTLVRSGRVAGDVITKKVMCRIGGGWQDLGLFVLNRQAGI